MSFGSRLIFAREKKGLNQKKLSELLEITPTRLNYWEKDKREPDVEMIKKIANILDTTGDFLLGLEDYEGKNYNIKDKQELLNLYNKLNTLGQEKAIERVEELTQIDKYTINNIDEELSITEEDIQEIKLYEIPASAGTGSFIDCDVPYEIKKVDLTVAPQARRADFALYVRGDSMEPDYYDGDIVFVKEQPKVKNKQIGIFIYYDVSYIKKYSIQDDGIYLISLNDKYKPIKVDKSMPFRTCGLVL